MGRPVIGRVRDGKATHEKDDSAAIRAEHQMRPSDLAGQPGGRPRRARFRRRVPGDQGRAPGPPHPSAGHQPGGGTEPHGRRGPSSGRSAGGQRNRLARRRRDPPGARPVLPLGGPSGVAAGHPGFGAADFGCLRCYRRRRHPGVGDSADVGDVLFASTGWGLPAGSCCFPKLDVGTARFTTLMPYQGRQRPRASGAAHAVAAAGGHRPGRHRRQLQGFAGRGTGPWRCIRHARQAAGSRPACCTSGRCSDAGHPDSAGTDMRTDARTLPSASTR